jgi:lipoate-protein ligase A
MAVDSALLQHQKRGVGYMLRLYRWNKPAVTIGYFQDMDKR